MPNDPLACPTLGKEERMSDLIVVLLLVYLILDKVCELKG